MSPRCGASLRSYPRPRPAPDRSPGSASDTARSAPRPPAGHLRGARTRRAAMERFPRRSPALRGWAPASVLTAGRRLLGVARSARALAGGGGREQSRRRSVDRSARRRRPAGRRGVLSRRRRAAPASRRRASPRTGARGLPGFLHPQGTPVCAAVGCGSRRAWYSVGPACRSASAGLPGIYVESGVGTPDTPVAERGACGGSLSSRFSRGGFRGLRGAPIPEYCPPPTRRRPRPHPPAAHPTRLARAAGGARAPAAPEGRLGGTNPRPARRGVSVAAGRAPSVKATLAALGASAALTAPTPPLVRGRRLAEKWAGSGSRPPRWRSRWSRRGSPLCGGRPALTFAARAPARGPAAGAHLRALSRGRQRLCRQT